MSKVIQRTHIIVPDQDPENPDKVLDDLVDKAAIELLWAILTSDERKIFFEYGMRLLKSRPK